MLRAVRPAQRRWFDAQGNEREPNISDIRKVNTGFLLSSFRVEARGDPDRLSPEELKGLVNKPELLSVTERHTPRQAVAFWLLEAELEALELGTEIWLKTRGDSPFIRSVPGAGVRLGREGDLRTCCCLLEPAGDQQAPTRLVKRLPVGVGRAQAKRAHRSPPRSQAGPRPRFPGWEPSKDRL